MAGMVSGYGNENAGTMEEYLEREMARIAEYNSQPDVIAKRKADAEWEAQGALKRNAAQRNPRYVEMTDYPWLRDEWEW